MNRISSFARTKLERLTRNWVYRRQLPGSLGHVPIYVSPSAGLKYLFKSMADVDPVLLQNVTDLVRPGDVVWDIGANIGLFSFAAAVRVGTNGRVVAFEPDAWLVQLLRRSAAVQPTTSGNVQIVLAAVASTVSIRQFLVATGSRAANALSTYGYLLSGKSLEHQTVVALSLDWLAGNLPLPNVIKCDVEGAEIEVFSHQSKILNEIRPAIVCEVGHDSAAGMTEILLAARYRIFDGEKPLILASETGMASWNTIGIPEESLRKYIADSE